MVKREKLESTACQLGDPYTGRNACFKNTSELNFLLSGTVAIVKTREYPQSHKTQAALVHLQLAEQYQVLPQSKILYLLNIRKAEEFSYKRSIFFPKKLQH